MELDDESPLVSFECQIVLRPDEKRLLGRGNHRLGSISEARQRTDGSFDVVSPDDDVEVDETPKGEIAVAGNGQAGPFYGIAVTPSSASERSTRSSSPSRNRFRAVFP